MPDFRVNVGDLDKSLNVIQNRPNRPETSTKLHAAPMRAAGAAAKRGIEDGRSRLAARPAGVRSDCNDARAITDANR